MSKVIEFVLWFIGSGFSLFGFGYIYYKFTNAKNVLNKKIVLYFLISTICLTLIYYFNVSFLGVITYFIFSPPLYYLIKYENFKKLIFYLFIIWIYCMILDLIAMAIASIVLKFWSFDNYWYIFEVAMSIILFVFIFIFSQNAKIKTFTSNLYEKLNNLKYFDFSLFLFSLFVFVVGIVVFTNIKNLNVSILLIIVILLMIIVFTILIKYKTHTIENEIFLKTLKDNNEFFIKMEDENRIFRHNLNGKLMSIKSVSNDKAKSLLNELLKENNRNVKMSESMKVVPYGFNGIIYEKVYPFTDKINIKINNDIFYDIFDVLTPRRYNVLVEKVVVALDNAIEATFNSKDKTLVINMFEESNNVIIEIQNTFSNYISLEDLGEIGYSTKGKKRGLGLFSSFRNNEAMSSIKVVNNIFVSKIVAKKNKS